MVQISTTDGGTERMLEAGAVHALSSVSEATPATDPAVRNLLVGQWIKWQRAKDGTMLWASMLKWLYL
jgi:hypothetical protein